MSGHHPWASIRHKTSQEAHAEVKRRLRVTNEQVLLAELRKHVELSTEELADRLGISKGASSKYDNQDDLSFLTVRSIVEALGGEMEIVIKLPKGQLIISPNNRAAA